MAGKLEVEAKYHVADRDTFIRFLSEEQMGRFKLTPAAAYQTEDIYQDTADNHLHQAGYACRVRRKGRTWVACLKEQGETSDMIHERMELDIELPYLELDPLRWPKSDVRQLAIQLSGGIALRRLFTIHQTRHPRIVSDERSQQIAEMSLDEVRVTMPGASATYYELEIERLSDEADGTFQNLAEVLLSQWSLEPQTQSKFLRAMALFQPGEDKEAGSDTAEHRVLTADHPTLERIAQVGRPLYARRAKLLLAWNEGCDIRTLIGTLGYSRSSVYHWLHAYQQDGIKVFPKQVLAQVERSLLERASEETPPSEQDGSPQLAARAPVPVDELYQRYDIDMDHARQVARLALELGDAAKNVHRLPDSARPLLALCAMLHNIGFNMDPDRHHTAGRDVILQTPVVELNDTEQLIVAAVIYLHRKRITRKKLQKRTVLAIPEEHRQEALNLAALVRIADGLDYSQSQSTRIIEVNVTPAVIEVVLGGPYALHDGARAQDKTDLWDLLHPVKFYFRTHNMAADPAAMNQSTIDVRPDSDSNPESESTDSEEAVEPVPPEPSAELQALADLVGSEPGVLASDMMSQAGRKLFRFQLYQMLLHEAGTRIGTDIEELHDMRVATRRLRSIARLVNEFFVPEKISPLIQGMRRTGRVLGAVRDLDVLIDKANRYQDTLGPGRQDELEPLLDSWRTQREVARQRMTDYLNSDKYHAFVKRMTRFVVTEGEGARQIDPEHPRPYLVCHVIPRLIYTHFEAVRAYEQWLDDPPLERLHALRIDCKRLRYALEFFREVLGPESKMVIKEVTALQDHLGELHDADVADHLLRDFLDGGTGSFASPPPSKRSPDVPRPRVMAPGVAFYLAEKQMELQTLVRTFPEAWSHFNRPEVRHNLAAAIAAL